MWQTNESTPQIKNLPRWGIEKNEEEEKMEERIRAEQRKEGGGGPQERWREDEKKEEEKNNCVSLFSSIYGPLLFCIFS